MAKKFEVVVTASLDKTSVAKIQNTLSNITKEKPIQITSDATDVTKLVKEVNSLNNAMAQSEESAQGLSGAVEKFLEWQLIGDVIHGIIDGLKDMVDQVFEIDASLTEFSKVSSGVSGTLDEVKDSAFALGEELARTGQDAIDAMTEFSKAGFEEQSEELARVALLYQNIADEEVSTSDAVALIVSQMKAFNITAEDSISIIDQINEVSNNFAVSSADLATAIPKVSATLSQAGNTMSETIALITAGTEIMTGQASRVARGLRSITLNLQGMDDEGNQNLELIASMESDFNKLGITLMDTDGQMKSTFEILKELAEVYPSLDQNTKNYFASLIGGKTQVDVVNSILTNFTTAIKANETAMNSSGSAMKESERYMNSLEGHLNQLKSAWQELANTTVNSNTVKGVLDLTTNVLKLIDSIGGLTTILPTLIGLIVMIKYDSIVKGITKIKDAVTGLGAAFTAQRVALLDIGLVISALMAIYAQYKQSVEDASEAHYQLAAQYTDEAAHGEELLSTYTTLIDKTNRTDEETQQLVDTIKDLTNNYGASTEALLGNADARDKEISKIKEEIVQKKKLAATEAEASLSVGYVDSDISPNAKRALTSMEGISLEGITRQARALEKSKNDYDLQAESIAKMQEKLQGYIETLENKDSLDKQQQKDLDNLTGLYDLLSEKITTWSNAYQQAYENLQEGIPITNSQANALYQLGMITEDEARMVANLNEVYQNATEEEKENLDTLWQNVLGVQEETEAIKEQLDANESLTNSFDSLSENLDNLQDTYKTLKAAVDEYNSDGYLSVDTLQSLLSLSDEYISALSLENGQLVLNTTALDQMTDSLIASRVEQLQASAVSDIYNLSIGNTESMSKLAQTAVNNLGNDASNMGEKFLSAVPSINAFTTALLNARQAAGETTNVEDFQSKSNAIISSYQDLYNKVTSLGATTTGRGGYASGSSHKYYGKTSKSKSGSGSSSKSSANTYKAEVNNLYAWENALDDAKDAVDQLDDALDNTDNFNEREEILRKLIDATNYEINATQDLKNAQVGYLNDIINQLRQYGFQIDYNAAKNQLFINNMGHLADFTGDTAKTVEKLIKKIQDLNDDNRDLDGSIRDLTGDVKDYYEQLADIPEEKLKQFNELMEEFQQSRLDQVQNQIDDLEHLLDTDPELKAIQARIDALEKENDTLETQQDLDEKLLAVEEAKEKLANANRERNIQIYREGQG